jgi:Family of unknown function (DUF6920)
VIHHDPARRIRQEWTALSSPRAQGDPFDSAGIGHLPEPVRRWLRHSIRQGTPLARSARLRMGGHIRIGAWRAFTATQILTPGVGFIWAATATFAAIPVLGYDKYVNGAGEMRWRVGGLIPVMSAGGPDITASAAGRLAIESVLVPTTFNLAQWSADDAGAHAAWQIDERHETVDLDIDNGGRLRRAVMQRWGNPGGAEFGRHPFAVDLDAERDFAGVTIPTEIRAGWWRGTADQADGEFFRATITNADFR